MTRLEDELRATFAGRIADVPVARDRAGSAIARGRAVRRRHRVITGAAAFLVVALLASGTWWVHGDRSSRGVVAGPGPSATGPALGSPQLDFVVGGELRPAGARPIPLPGKGDVYDAVRVREGWLIVRGDKSVHALWLVRTDGTSTPLVGSLPPVFVFSRHNELAYQQGSTITVMTFDLAKGEAHRKATTYVPGADGPQGHTGAEVVGWVGDSYLVLGNRLGLDYDGFTLMAVADNQGLAPNYNRAVIGVYGATPDGRFVVGTVKNSSTGQTCAAVLDQDAGFTVKNRRCGQPYLSLSRHALSPDGRRILGRADQGIGIADAGSGALIARVPATQGMWPAEPVWVDDRAFVVAGNDRLLYVNVADPTHPRELPVPSTSERWMVVAPAGT